MNGRGQRLRILVAPDKFKGSLDAGAAARCIEKGIKSAIPTSQVMRFPLADGGEGTVDAILNAVKHSVSPHNRVQHRSCKVHGPLMKPVRAEYGWIHRAKPVAVLEMAAASGLVLLAPHQRNPLKTTSYGTGELIRHVVEQGAKEVWIGLGGSATNEGGAGAAQAMGYLLRDRNDRILPPGIGGGQLEEVHSIQPSEACNLYPHVRFRVLTDVTNPLLGPCGATTVFGPQKGVTGAMHEKLERGMAHWAGILKRDLGADVLKVKGGGAAGGIGALLHSLIGAPLESGIQALIEISKLGKILKGMDLVITGEGKIDAQSAAGKTVCGIARLGQSMNIPVIALAGQVHLGREEQRKMGITAGYGMVDAGISVEKALDKPCLSLKKLARHALENFQKKEIDL